jgi:hypothetical protein
MTKLFIRIAACMTALRFVILGLSAAAHGADALKTSAMTAIGLHTGWWVWRMGG